ncbi:helix-turn-helix transcriptional regulator [Microbacteriaceae bacterium VKM Ac-2855]|nr:helix-turn-helix transcriptional regulator [Microbacteriaceae bacterium VKM Ac-2855]
MTTESPELPATSYALLGLLLFYGRTETGVTGYELKQRADRTLRYYWVAPAMSQVYSELSRLVRAELVEADPGERRGATTYRITDAGEVALRRWLDDRTPEFPVLKHPVALRLLMGHLSTPEKMKSMLEDYLVALEIRRAELQGVRDMLGENPAVRYAAMVADWGLEYYDAETVTVTGLLERAGASLEVPLPQP